MTEYHEKKRGRTYLRVILVLSVLAILGLLVRVRTYDLITANAQALWSKDELYIFAEQNKVAWSQNAWAFSWSMAKRAVGIQTAPDFHRIDCLVYRITNTAVEEHLAKGWHVAGTVAPINNVPHAFIGGEADTRGVFRWTGSGFVRLSPSETESLERGFTYTDELFKREGWTQLSVLPVRGTADHPLTLSGIHFTLRASQTEDGMSKIELINTDNPKLGRALYGLKNATGFLSRSAYKAFLE